MKSTLLIIILLISKLLFSFEESEEQQCPLTIENLDSTQISAKKLSIAIGANLMTSFASYYVIENAWWREDAIDFHFDNGADLRYAKNMDKLGHFFGGYVIQDVYYRSLIWSKLKKENALWLSLGFSVFAQIMIDVKDGYAPEWGFSIYDVLSGSAGGVYSSFQKLYPVLEDYKFKISYYNKESNYELDHKWQIENWIENYPSQTYWLTTPCKNLPLGSLRKVIPDYIGLAIGLSVEDKVNYSNDGNYELYLSFDLDLEKLVKPVNNYLLSSIAHYLNYIKIPAPTIKLNPKIQGYWLYF